MTVWKYKIYVSGQAQAIEVPGADEAKVVAARISDQHDIIDIWIEVDPLADKSDLEFRVFGTGHPITTTPDRQTVHTATVFDDRLGLVWHLYQLHEVPA